jgi:hypothetical protein
VRYWVLGVIKPTGGLEKGRKEPPAGYTGLIGIGVFFEEGVGELGIRNLREV